MATFVSRNRFGYSSLSFNTSGSSSGTAIRVDSGSHDIHIVDNDIPGTTNHAIYLVGVNGQIISGNRIAGAGAGSANTYDAIHLAANVDACFIHSNRIRSDSGGTRYGINVSVNTCENNVIVGNDLGGSADYGTDALNDAGTGTELSYPGDATYGDNFVS